MKSGNTRLYQDFVPPPTVKTRRDPKKSKSYLTTKNWTTPSPKKPTIQTFSSPDPTVKSHVYNRDLLDHETDLSLREEEFLIELKEFYEGVLRSNEYKEEYEEMLRSMNQGAFSLIETAAQLSAYQDILEQRAQIAQNTLTEPLDDYKGEEKLVMQLEAEVLRLQSTLPGDVSPDAEETIAKMIKEIEELDKENELSREAVRNRQVENEKKLLEIEDANIELDRLERDEDMLYKKYLRDKETLEKTPKINIREIKELNRMKEELENRRRAAIQKDIEFKNYVKEEEAKNAQLTNEIQALQKEYRELSELKRKREQTLLDIQQINEAKQNGLNYLKESENEIEKLKAQIESQKDELAKLNEKRANLDRKRGDLEKNRQKLLKREEELRKRRELIDGSSDEFKAIRDETDAMKRRVEEIYKEVEKLRAQFRQTSKKVSKAQKELEEKSGGPVESPYLPQIDELQKLLSESDMGSSSHDP